MFKECITKKKKKKVGKNEIFAENERQLTKYLFCSQMY